MPYGELPGWQLSRTGKATTAASALEHAPISRLLTLGRANRQFLLRSDRLPFYRSLFTSRKFTALMRGYGPKQEFITLYCPQQKGMVEGVIWTLKEQCAHRHRCESIQYATRAVGD